MKVIRLGTRGSNLARRQTQYVATLLRERLPGVQITIQVVKTKGDRIVDTPLPLIGGKGLFTAELELALRSGEIDLAVHSLKDLPTELPRDMPVGATPPRADPADVLVSRDRHGLDSLPEGARVGTSSRRRAAQLLHQRADLEIVDIRGNADTRIRKALDPQGRYTAIVLARAGLERLGRLDVPHQLLALEQMLPAPGQGALAIQCRSEPTWLDLLSLIHDQDTGLAVAAERAFLSGLGGGCAVPVAAFGRILDGKLSLSGRVSAIDGRRQIDVNGETSVMDIEGASGLGLELARMALNRGADRILEAIG